MSNVLLDPSNEQHALLTAPSSDAQDWKCRECGFVNRTRDTICDTCATPKPMRPLLETRLSYTNRDPSPSPSNRHSRSPSEEMYGRAGSSSPPSVRRKSSHSYSSDENQYASSRNNTKQRASRSSIYLSLLNHR